MPNQAQSRRDRQKGKKGFSKNKGFTLIELMIAVGVVAIIMSLALPSYRAIIEKRQVTSGAEQLGAFMSAVQSEAVKRSDNVSVTYSYTSATEWCVGMVTGQTPCDCSITAQDSANCTIDGAVRIINQDNVNHPEVMNNMVGDGDFMFDPARGLVFHESGSGLYDTAVFEIENERYALNVLLNQTGRVKVCSDSASKKVPGYEECLIQSQ